MNENLVNFIYLIAGVLFILGIKGLTKPKTAVRGNMLSALGYVACRGRDAAQYEYRRLHLS